jgi:acetoacetyl-CoA synthetase
MNETAQLFRSVRAARAWVNAVIARPETAPAAGCVMMKPGNDEPPVFLIPGATGSVLQLAPLASAMSIPMPVYAIKPRGMEEDETPCRHLCEMAEHAIAVMTVVQGQGPYLLVGYSAGGLVALEMARQLAATGRDVKLVVLLDTYPSREVWPLRCHVEVLVRQAVRAIWFLRRCTLRQAAREVTRRVRSLFWYLAASGVKLIEPPPLVIEGTDAASRRVHEATYNAGEAYRPPRYAGKVVFVQPECVTNLEPRQPRRVWGQFLGDLEIRQVPGSHFGMLNEGAEAAAKEISRYLADAVASSP